MKFIIKYWYYILIPILLLPVVLKLYKDYKTTPKNKEEQANDVLNQNSAENTKKDLYKRLTISLAHHLGTAYGWWNYKNWTENDKEVYNIMIGLTDKDFEIIKLLYSQIYAKGHNLSVDLQKYMDSDLYEKLTVK